MTQPSDITLANQVGSSYRAEHNSINLGFGSTHKGNTAPSYAVAGMMWVDDTADPWELKIYDGADWILMGTVDTTSNLFNPVNALEDDTVTETITSSAVDFNLNSALYYIVNVDQDFTATFSGLESGVTNNAYIELINAGDHTVTWTNAAWDGGSEAPLLGTRGAYDLTVASYDNVSFSVSGQEGIPRSINFKPDGTKMYMIGDISANVFQYTLSTPWDLSTASFDNVSFDVSGQDGETRSIHLKSDGTKMYMVGRNSESVHQYTLSTPWDLSTASYDNVSFSVSGQDGAPQGVHFKTDGTKMYMVGNVSDSVHQYTLSTPWDLSTVSYDNVSFDVSGQDSTPVGIHFKPDGTKMYMVGRNSASVYQYTLSTPWDLSTASYDNISFSVSGQDATPFGIHFKPDGAKMYMVGNNSDSFYQYSTGTTGSQSTLIEAIAQDDGTTPVKLRKIWDEA